MTPNFVKTACMGTAPKLRLTLDEFMAMEAQSLEKHEYYGGEIFDMAGASLVHNRIVSNTHIEIGTFLKRVDRGCDLFPSDLKVFVGDCDFLCYPDLSIVCGPIESHPNHPDAVSNPSVIVEVLSPSTQSYDRGEKFHFYRQLPSLQCYVLISSLSILVEVYHKQADGSWLLRAYGKADEFTIIPIGLALSVHDLYRNVAFD
jgi:Uma2 family endonuclease